MYAHASHDQHIELWSIERLREYARNPRKNDCRMRSTLPLL